MATVKRIYVEKKEPYAVRAGELKQEIKKYLDIKTLEEVRVLVRYDVEALSEDVYKKALVTVFSEPPVDNVYEGSFEKNEKDRVFSVEYLPGQFDQRADSAEQCVKLLNEKEEPIIRSATTYVLSGDISEEDFERIKAYCINPVDSRETDETVPETLVQKFDEPADVKIFDGFKDMPEAELKKLYDSLGLAMTFKDFLHIQNYFHGEENRDPSMTEIRVLDTYWSDHCRHTTFQTELKNISFEDGDYKKPIEDTYKAYKETHDEMYKGRDDKFVCLMDIALLAMKKLREEGKLDDMEVSDEINACSIVVPVDIDHGNGPETEEWLVFFKNETHNHPTEIEPFGGAATCLGGAIRDPLSGRGYVYQAMRVTGAAALHPRKSLPFSALSVCLPYFRMCHPAFYRFHRLPPTGRTCRGLHFVLPAAVLHDPQCLPLPLSHHMTALSPSLGLPLHRSALLHAPSFLSRLIPPYAHSASPGLRFPLFSPVPDHVRPFPPALSALLPWRSPPRSLLPPWKPPVYPFLFPPPAASGQ